MTMNIFIVIFGEYEDNAEKRLESKQKINELERDLIVKFKNNFLAI